MINDILYPNKCMFCGEPLDVNIPFCKNCFERVKSLSDNRCNRCGREVENCFCKVGDFAFSRNISCFYYSGPVRTMVSRFKYHNLFQLSASISKYMIQEIDDKYSDFTADFITFVPMHFAKLVVRGYNPAKLIAQRISNSISVPIEDVLTSKFTFKSQKHLSREQRRKNVKGKFRVKKRDIEGKNVLLIDDVMTTGSTLSECALMLKRAGAKEVRTATFAITLKK